MVQILHGNARYKFCILPLSYYIYCLFFTLFLHSLSCSIFLVFNHICCNYFDISLSSVARVAIIALMLHSCPIGSALVVESTSHEFVLVCLVVLSKEEVAFANITLCC